MLLTRLWNFFNGYAIITVKDLKIEQIINLAVKNNIYLWDIEKCDYVTIKVKISIKDFIKLRRIIKKSNTKVCIKEKRGLPFGIKIVKKKKFFIFGLGALLIFLYILSSYVWMIEISGQSSISENAILTELTSNGLQVGVLKRKINKRNIENKTLINMPELAWVGIELKGTKAYVTVSEKVEEPDYIDINEPCDIIAIKNAVIDRILVLNGNPVVKDGDTVEKGQLLVSGVIEHVNDEIRYVHSIAQIEAKAWYEDTEEISFKQIEYKTTGRKTKEHEIELLGINKKKKKNKPYKEYNKDIIGRQILNFGNYVFPIKFITTIYTELKPIEKSLTIDEAKLRCSERLEEKIKLQYPSEAKARGKKIEYFIKQESVKGKIYVETVEDISKKRIIDIY